MNRFVIVAYSSLLFGMLPCRAEDPPQPNIPKVYRKLIQDLSGGDVGTRRKAAVSLKQAMAFHSSVVDSLGNALRDQDEEVRRTAAQALCDFRPPETIAVPNLVRCLKDSSEEVRAAAAFALGYVGPAASKEVVSGLTEALADDDIHTRRTACSSLGMIGPQAKAAVPALIGMLKDKNAGKDHDGLSLRECAAIVLGHIGCDLKPALCLLLDILRNDQDRDLQIAVCYPLSKVTEQREMVLRAFLDLYKDKNKDYIRGTVARAIGRFGAGGKSAIPVLIEGLDVSGVKDPKLSEFIQDATVEALGAIGPEAKNALPVLERLAKDEAVSASVRHSAQRSLEAIRR